MDKRIIKTKEAIHKGFYDILEKKDYDAVTIQDILNESGVSRSAFYANFKSKNEVLLSITSDIFDHVFSISLTKRKPMTFQRATSSTTGSTSSTIYITFPKRRNSSKPS